MPIITDLAYDKNGKKRSQTNRALFRRIEYTYEKAERVGANAVDTQNPHQIYKDFLEVKKEFNSNGINFFHYVISFDNTDNITANQVEEIAIKFFNDSKFDGHQLFYAIHNDTDNYHCHFIVNSTNMINGKKFHLSDSERMNWFIKINELGLEYNCRVPNKIAKIMNIKQQKKDSISKNNTKYESNNKSWKEKTKNTVNFIIKNVTSENELKKVLKDSGYELYQNQYGSHILKIPYLNKKISFELLEIDYSDAVKRIKFNSSQDTNIQENMKLNIKNLIEKNKFMTQYSAYNELKNKSQGYYFEKEQETNKKQFYKDLVADINKFVRENKHLKQDYERQLGYILKCNLNMSVNIEETISKLKEIGINPEYKNDNKEIILNFDNIKLSSKYLNIDIDKSLNQGISFKYDIFKKVNDTKKIAKNKEEFIKILKEQYNIDTIWTSERKYITFIDEKGNKKRNSSFYPPENWTKSKFEQSFKYNANRFYKEKRKNDSKYIENQQYVKSKIYEHLNTCKNYKEFEKKLNQDNIKFDKDSCKFEFKDFKFWESKYFNINKEYIEERFEQNKMQNLYVINSVFRFLSRNDADFKMYSHTNTSANSIVEFKDMIAEQKKGKNLNDMVR